MDESIMELIAIGASITANCQPCLRSHVEKALKFGARPEEVAMAMEIGRRVRKGAATKMDEVSASLMVANAPVSADVVLGAKGCDYLGP